MNVRLYLWQRVTAAIMVPMIVVHLAVIFYAVNDRLTAAQILARTQGSIAWGLFYGAFVLLASIHASIGIRNVLSEWGRSQKRRRWRGRIRLRGGIDYSGSARRRSGVLP